MGIFQDRMREKQLILELGLEDATFAGIFPVVVGTQEVYNYLDTTNNNIVRLNSDIIASSAYLSQEFKSSWVNYVDGWRKFYSENRKTTHFFGAAGVMDEIDVWTQQASDYQTDAKSQAGENWKGATPTIQADPNSSLSPQNQETLKTIRTVAIAGAVGLGALGAIAIFRR